MYTTLMQDTHKKTHLVLDDVYSFVLRLHLNPAPGGQGVSRPYFNLVNVNKGTNRRMHGLDEALQELRSQIEMILQDPGSGIN